MDISKEHNMDVSYICDETKDLIDLSDEELDGAMAEVIIDIYGSHESCYEA